MPLSQVAQIVTARVNRWAAAAESLADEIKAS